MGRSSKMLLHYQRRPSPLLFVVPALFTVSCFFYFGSLDQIRIRSYLMRPPPPSAAVHFPAWVDDVNPFAHLYAPLKPIVSEPRWSDWLGNEFTIEGEPRFKAGIKRYIAIVDVDSRDFPITEKDMYKWDDIETHDAGVLNHYLYAQIHGYDYKFIKMPSISDRHDTWLKVAGIAHLLHDYQFVVFLDNDATFANMELPMEWMLNHWNIHENVTIAVSDTPGFKGSLDIKGGAMANTGFVIAQNTELTHTLLKRWAECPEESYYEDCSKYREDFPHEQGAFSDFIRYDPEFEDTVVRLSCDETNGHDPNHETRPKRCGGFLIKHWWSSKASVKSVLSDTIMRDMLRMSQVPGPGLSEKVLKATFN